MRNVLLKQFVMLLLSFHRSHIFLLDGVLCWVNSLGEKPAVRGPLRWVNSFGKKPAGQAPFMSVNVLLFVPNNVLLRIKVNRRDIQARYPTGISNR